MGRSLCSLNMSLILEVTASATPPFVWPLLCFCRQYESSCDLSELENAGTFWGTWKDIGRKKSRVGGPAERGGAFEARRALGGTGVDESYNSGVGCAVAPIYAANGAHDGSLSGKEMLQYILHCTKDMWLRWEPSSWNTATNGHLRRSLGKSST